MSIKILNKKTSRLGMSTSDYIIPKAGKTISSPFRRIPSSSAEQSQIPFSFVALGASK